MHEHKLECGCIVSLIDGSVIWPCSAEWPRATPEEVLKCQNAWSKYKASGEEKRLREAVYAIN